MPYFITIQYPYQYLTITLSDNTTIIATQTISKFQAISLLLPTLKLMLETHNLTLANIACFGINTGPGPFNTLRSIIATANAISFAQHIPLVGCNGLDLLLQEHDNNTVAILDAFGNDVYFAMKGFDNQGYDSIENVIKKLNNLHTSSISFIGNGASKHKDYILSNCKGIANFDETALFASTQTLVDATYKKFLEGKIERELFPLYFASPVVKI